MWLRLASGSIFLPRSGGARKLESGWSEIRRPSFLGSRGSHEKSGRTVSLKRHLAARLRPPPGRHRCDHRRGELHSRVGDGVRAGARRGAGVARGPADLSGHGRRGLCRAAHRLGRHVRLRQLRQRGRALLRRARQPSAAPVHPDAARRSGRRHGRRLRQSLRPAGHRHGSGRGGPDQRARPDVQRLEGTDAARLLRV